VRDAITKIIVVGAGAAGLTAGHLLEQRGIDFEILEARPTSGGRVRKLEGFADFPIAIRRRHMVRRDRPPRNTEPGREAPPQHCGDHHRVWARVSGRDGDVLNECVYDDAAFGKDSNSNVLGLFTQGTKAECYTAHATDEELFNYVGTELDEIFDGQASKHDVDHVIEDWTREPYIYGSYSQRKASANKLAQPVARKVFFAGEAMNPNGKTIAVHGACESAYSAIDAMLARLTLS